MKATKKILVVLLVLLATGLPTVWLLTTYHIVDWKLYPKNAEILDLRGRELTLEKYERLKEKMPGTRIRWDVPFQQGKLADDAEEISVTSLSEEDGKVLAAYFSKLRTVHAEACTDYDALAYLGQLRPDVKVNYRVAVNGTAYDGDAAQICIDGITEQELELLQYLPVLETVTVTGGEREELLKLQTYCRKNVIALQVTLQGSVISEDTESLTLSGIDEKELGAVLLLENLKALHIRLPEASADSLLQLREACPDLQISWEREICGTVYSTADVPEEMDLSNTEGLDLALLEEELAYFSEVEQVYLGLCGIDNEALAAFRDRVREQYKVVWMVQCGPRLTARTDDTSFMPLREGLPTFTDEEIYNLRYCEDMICVDVGHMKITNIEFAKFMPNLEYLILAHTRVSIIEPLRNCKKLKFLEVDYTPVCDLSALLDCTGLEDLNVGFTSVPLDPVKQMTWLKNLWMIHRSGAEEMAEALPNTTIMAVGNASVANGWRKLPNYFAMRDALGMYYMSW